jgi:urease accessory protein
MRTAKLALNAMVQTSDAIFAANRAASRVTLAVKSAAGATRRDRVHEAGALRVRCPNSPGPELEAMIVNTAGGMTGGDRFAVHAAVGPDARLVVTTAAAEKVYRALDDAATVDIDLTVAAGGALAWLPQETILFDRARLRRSIAIDLAADAQLVLLESMVFGRTAMGEAVADGLLFDRWRIRRGGALIYADTLHLDGPIAERLRRPAVADGAVAVATLVVVPGSDAIVDAVRACHDRFHGEVGASAWNGLAAVRLVARDGAALRHDLLIVLGIVRGQALPRTWLN